MKTLKVKSILFSLLTILVASIFLVSCEQESLPVVIEELEGLRPAEVGTLESFQTTDISQLIEDLNLSTVSLEDTSIEIEKTMDGSDEITKRTWCCDVGSIANLAGGTNRFRIPLTYDANSRFVITVWQGGKFWASNIISIPFNSCTTSHHYTDLDYYAPIQQGESYVLRVFLFNETGPSCDMGIKSFIGE